MSNDTTETPMTESGEWPAPDYAQQIIFEGCSCVVMSPEEYSALYNSHSVLERENAALRSKLGEMRELLQTSVGLIKTWHNMGMPEGDAETWRIYYEHAPEMKSLRAALSTDSEMKEEG